MKYTGKCYGKVNGKYIEVEDQTAEIKAKLTDIIERLKKLGFECYAGTLEECDPFIELEVLAEEL